MWCKANWSMKNFIENQIEKIRAKVGKDKYYVH